MYNSFSFFVTWTKPNKSKNTHSAALKNIEEGILAEEKNHYKKKEKFRQKEILYPSWKAIYGHILHAEEKMVQASASIASHS